MPAGSDGLNPVDCTMPAALMIAWALDAAVGEPPNAVHPVA